MAAKSFVAVIVGLGATLFLLDTGNMFRFCTLTFVNDREFHAVLYVNFILLYMKHMLQRKDFSSSV